MQIDKKNQEPGEPFKYKTGFVFQALDVNNDAPSFKNTFVKVVLLFAMQTKFLVSKAILNLTIFPFRFWHKSDAVIQMFKDVSKLLVPVVLRNNICKIQVGSKPKLFKLGLLQSKVNISCHFSDS